MTKTKTTSTATGRPNSGVRLDVLRNIIARRIGGYRRDVSPGEQDRVVLTLDQAEALLVPKPQPGTITVDPWCDDEAQVVLNDGSVIELKVTDDVLQVRTLGLGSGWPVVMPVAGNVFEVSVKR